MSKYIIDDLDKKILNILQKNADLTYAEIAKEVNVSPSTVHLRVKRLKELGYIKFIVAVVDPRKLGLNIRAYVFIKTDPKKHNEALEKIAKMKEVVELYDITGEYSAVAKVYATDNEGLAKILDTLGQIEGVLSTSTSLVMRAIKELPIVQL
ncbi:MAG: AsnC family transcriptional regulator [Desulfurococcales archaeon ex4484_217_1]|nr:MAG: AsnC family transcriptional regulator [Desulfurococcales archaeon ex4484_217_1]